VCESKDLEWDAQCIRLPPLSRQGLSAYLRVHRVRDAYQSLLMFHMGRESSRHSSLCALGWASACRASRVLSPRVKPSATTLAPPSVVWRLIFSQVCARTKTRRAIIELHSVVELSCRAGFERVNQILHADAPVPCDVEAQYLAGIVADRSYASLS
jgi:hypothetical protein